jgi:hypothetical protein
MNKFRQFAFDLLTNRTGIFLATINVCFFVSRDFDAPHLRFGFFENLMLIQNVPAMILTRAIYEILEVIFPAILGARNMSVIAPLFIFFIVFQWLFVAWLAKSAARMLRKDFLNQG